MSDLKHTSDYISRNLAIDLVDCYYRLSEMSRTIRDALTVQDILKKMPDANVPKRGVAIWTTSSDKKSWYTCSNCGEVIFSNSCGDLLNHHSYCGHCGFYMTWED